MDKEYTSTFNAGALEYSPFVVLGIQQNQKTNKISYFLIGLFVGLIFWLIF